MRAPFSRTLHDLLCEQAARLGDHPVVVCEDQRHGYAALAERAATLAGAFRDRGMRRGDRIGLLAPNRIEWLEVFFAAAALGATVVPFSTWSTRSELEFLIADSGISWLFCVERIGTRDFAADIAELSKASPALRHVVSIDGSAFIPLAEMREGAALGDLPPGEGASATDHVLILYTSGSSSRPKAVPLLHAATIENAFNIGERQGLGRQDRVLVSVPLFWAYGAINALPAVLSHGATLVLQSHFEAGGAIDLIERHGCTALYTLPAMTNALIADPEFAPERCATLRTGVMIGSPQDVLKAARELGASGICNIYGGTENGGNCCVTPTDWPLERRAACQGPPLPGVRVRIREPETGTLQPAGEVGEIEVTGYLTPGYAGDSARFNAAAFTDDGWFRTGDLGFLDAEGAMNFTGRLSEMIKRSGVNVSPVEVEETLQRHSDVAMAGVTGLEDAARGEIIVAYVTARPGRTLDGEAVLAHCRAELSRYKLPDRLIVTDALPLTATGKLMRRELTAMARRDAS